MVSIGSVKRKEEPNTNKKWKGDFIEEYKECKNHSGSQGIFSVLKW